MISLGYGLFTNAKAKFFTGQFPDKTCWTIYKLCGSDWSEWPFGLCHRDVKMLKENCSNIGKSVLQFGKVDQEWFLIENYKRWATNGTSVSNCCGKFKHIVSGVIRKICSSKTLNTKHWSEVLQCWNSETKGRISGRFGNNITGWKREERGRIAAERKAEEHYIRNIFGNESNGWGPIYKYVS